MRRLTIFLAALTLFSCCLVPASAATVAGCYARAGTVTFSPSLPKLSNPKQVATHVAMLGTFDHCTKGLGVQSGRIRFSSVKIAGSSCKSFLRGENFSPGSFVITWNTGTTTSDVHTLSFASHGPGSPSRSMDDVAFFRGSPLPRDFNAFHGRFLFSLPTGACTSKGLSKLTYNSGNIVFGHTGL
jgi:hypothetical protein